jgi:hypothetical protein
MNEHTIWYMCLFIPKKCLLLSQRNTIQLVLFGDGFARSMMAKFYYSKMSWKRGERRDNFVGYYGGPGLMFEMSMSGKPAAFSLDKVAGNTASGEGNINNNNYYNYYSRQQQ